VSSREFADGLADALVVRDWVVEHLEVGDERAEHRLPSFAVVVDGRLSYRPAQGSLFEQ